MKKLLSLQLTIISILLVFEGGCVSSLSNTSNIDELANKTLLLEILNETSETVYPKGKTLEIRLYDNKDVEFDFYPPNTPDRVGMPFMSERKTANLSQADFDEIKGLLSNSDLLKAKESYASTRRGLDATIKKTISLKFENQEKIIVLEENDSHLHLDEKSNIYPTTLIKLLELTGKVNKKLRKQINPESR